MTKNSPSSNVSQSTVSRIGTVSFIGAGPGDPELLTLKGARLIAEADLVLYAGSLVPPQVVAGARPSANVIDSSSLCLEETHALMRHTALSGGSVARVHTGDPGLYGAVQEQARLLDADNIPWEIVPGVTAAFAAAAAAKVSLTTPEVTQSVVITRLSGRTPVPPSESLALWAAHGATLAIYLSAADPEGMQRELEAACPPHYSPENWRATTVVCAYRVGWPDQRIARATVSSLAACAREHHFTRQTVFLILPGEINAENHRSCLYDPSFTHGWRTEGELDRKLKKGRDPEADKG